MDSWDITLGQLLDNFSGLPQVSVYYDDFEYDEGAEVVFTLVPTLQDYKTKCFLRPEIEQGKITRCKMYDGIVKVSIDIKEL